MGNFNCYYAEDRPFDYFFGVAWCFVTYNV